MSEGFEAGIRSWDPEPAPEVWRLHHPEHGLLEVAVGRPAALYTLDPGFPIGENPRGPAATRGFVLLRDGAPVARSRQTKDKKVPLTEEPIDDSRFSEDHLLVKKPRVAMTVAAFGDAVRHVTFSDKGEVVLFDPPPGSAAEARLTAIEASPWKRVVYPIAGGLGKASHALAAIVVVPVIMPILERLWPDIDIDVPLPDIEPPSIPVPEVDLPTVELPQIHLPSFTIPWPDVDVPAWVELLLEYPQVWVPVVVGIAVAIAAVRHARNSRRTRQRWEADRARRDEEG